MSVVDFPSLFYVVFIFVTYANGLHEEEIEQPREKRQTTNGPVFSQPSFSFCVVNPSQGTVVGKVTLSSVGTGQSFFSFPTINNNLAIDQATGSITIVGTLPTTQNLVVQAMDMVGLSTTASVTIITGNSCSNTGNTENNGNSGNMGNNGGSMISFPQLSYLFQLPNCKVSAIIGKVAVSSVPPGTIVTYSLDSYNNSKLMILPFTGEIYLRGGIVGNFVTTVTATSSTGEIESVPVVITSNVCETVGTTPVWLRSVLNFGTTTYTFHNANGNAGSPIDQVFATNSATPGATVTYRTTSRQFTVNLVNGLVSVGTAPLPPGTYTLSVTAYDSTGQTKTTTVTVNVTRAG
ncbi:hypothetical protein BV898_04645 [Hypsibius exemplaris]|uniref:Cadherin domain-containing protein n=1 Tax=Hypsibius exemplaris TaxID=2072580 RepID=A0A1W0X1U1_HYPEX|nr:hypothetical protein BV898_04645 [Hypsibius exemplaris]